MSDSAAIRSYVADPDFALWHGDALEVLRSLDRVDAIVSSPPYLDARPEYGHPTEKWWEQFFDVASWRVAGPVLLNVGRIWRNGVEHPEGGRPPSYVTIHTGREKGNPHPAPMPEALAEHLVKLASWPGQLVFDPFGGSGTTALAARKLGRRSVLAEIDADYCAIAAKRLAQQTLEGAAA